MALPWIKIYTCLWFFLLEIVVYQCEDEDVDENNQSKSKFSNDDTLIFSTCNSKGRYGPSNASCSFSYVNTSLESVSVEEKWPGVQIWMVPRTGQYGILAIGAMGGRSAKPLHQSHTKKHLAQYVFAFFNLTEGTQLYILVGQKGEDACSPSDCEKADVKQASRGGAGGGATYVLQVDQTTNQLTPFLIAGGGGGVGMGTFLKDVSMVCTEYYCTKTDRERTGPSLAGNGSSWNDLIKNGKFMIGGSVGRLGCSQQNGSHEAIGGFGGGGYSCQGAGGGGGGVIGGRGGGENVGNGQDGASFISTTHGDEVKYGYRIRGAQGNGEVEIYEYFYCPCEDQCIAINSQNRTYKCACTDGKELMPDEHNCKGTKSDAVGPLLDEDATGKPQDDSQQSYVPYKELIIPCLIGLFVVAVLIIMCKVPVVRVVKRWLNLTSPESCSGPALVSKTTPSHINRIVMQINASYSAVNFTNPNMEIKLIPREQIKCIRPIGRGAFGEVFQGTLSPNGKEQYAFKVAIKTLPAVCTEELEMDFVMEAVIMSKFEHPNIVKFLGVCFDSVRPHYIVLELLEGGSLKEFLFEARPKPETPTMLTVPELVKISINIAKGCQYLEERHFIHRDIAARNCLLSAKGSDRVAKIADFGMARDIYRSDYYRKTGRALLPVKWMPPEAYLDGVFTSKSDVWAYGITLWEIFSMASNPYPGQANHEVMEFVLEGGRLRSPENCPLALYHIMTCTWDPNPDMRPSFSTIVQKLQYCYDDPNTASYKLPTFNHCLSSKCNFVRLSDVEKGQSREARKKSSTSSIYSLSSLDSLNFDEDKHLPYDSEMSVTKGDVVKIPNGYAVDMISCLDAKASISEGIDNPICRALLVDIDSSDDLRNTYKDAKVNGVACSGTSIRSKSNDYSRGLTGDQGNSKNRNLHRHHSHPNPNRYQNHYTHYPKRHQSLRQQQQTSENTHIDEKSKPDANSGELRHHASLQAHTRDSNIHPSPSKVPLLSSPSSGDTPEDEDEFFSRQQSTCGEESGEKTTVNGLITERTDANNILMKSMRNRGACPKYINLASNLAYLNTTILDENNC